MSDTYKAHCVCGLRAELDRILQMQIDMREQYGDPSAAIRAGGMRAQLNVLGWSDLYAEEAIIRRGLAKYGEIDWRAEIERESVPASRRPDAG